MPLTVPQQYKLLNYQTIDPSFIRYDYTTHKLSRSLRVGAEDELIKLDEPALSTSIQISEKPIIIQPNTPSSLLKAPIYHPLTALVCYYIIFFFCIFFLVSFRIQHLE